MDKQPSFPERTKRMFDIAHQLAELSDELSNEAARMRAAAERFDQRRKERPTRKAD